MNGINGISLSVTNCSQRLPNHHITKRSPSPAPPPHRRSPVMPIPTCLRGCFPAAGRCLEID